MGEAHLVAPWNGRIVALGMCGAASPVTPIKRYVGVPGMNAMAKHLACGIEVPTGCPITELVRDAGAWHLHSGTGETLGPFDALVLAVPPEQATRLTAPVELLDTAERVELLPCWCAMAAFDAPLPVEFDDAFVDDTVLGWVARDSSKPGRSAGESHHAPHYLRGRLVAVVRKPARRTVDCRLWGLPASRGRNRKSIGSRSIFEVVFAELSSA